MVDVLDGYCFHVVCRQGLSANTPAMQMGEIGFDTDTRVFRIGNDTYIPEKIMGSNSKIAFEYPYVPYVKFNSIELYPGGKVAGVDLSSIASNGPGLLAVDGSGAVSVVSLTSGDSTVSITNGDGLYGNPDIRSSGSGGGLSTIVTTTALNGAGTSLSPLDVAQATTSKLGGAVMASAAEVLAGAITTKFVTPNTLYSTLQNASTIGHASDIAFGSIRLATIAEAALGLSPVTAISPYTLAAVLNSSAFSTTTSFTGSGSASNPLTLEQATDTLLGGVVRATTAEVIAGTDTTKYVVPSDLKDRLDTKADTASPSLTGTPETVSPSFGDSSTQIPNTAWVQMELAAISSSIIGTAPASLNTLGELSAAIGNDPNFLSSLLTALSGKADNARTISTTSPILGGGNLSTDRTLSIDKTWFDGYYADKNTVIVGNGLAFGGGSISSNRVITVQAASSAEALALSRNDVAITPLVLKDVTDWLYAKILEAPPATLDTLQEIATSLANDPAFATTMTTQLALKAPVARIINTTSPLQGGGNLGADITLTFNQAWSDGLYTPLTRTLTAAGLVTGGGSLSANRTFTVTASSNAQAIAGVDTTTAMTPASTAAAYLPLVGGTLTGNLLIDNVASSTLRLDKGGSGFESAIGGYTNGTIRWFNYLSNATAEGGANSGSDYELRRYSDVGAYLGSPLTISRATGAAYFESTLYVGGVQVLPGTYPASSVTVTGGGLVTGGGDLTANRVLTVAASSNAQAVAAVDTTTAMTPASTAAAMNSMFVTQATTPTTPRIGMVWFNTTNHTLNMYMNDGAANVWIQIA